MITDTPELKQLYEGEEIFTNIKKLTHEEVESLKLNDYLKHLVYEVKIPLINLENSEKENLNECFISRNNEKI